jgi:hypothetical protein
MAKSLYMTITGTNYSYGMKPFEICGQQHPCCWPKDDQHRLSLRSDRGLCYAQILFVTSTKMNLSDASAERSGKISGARR